MRFHVLSLPWTHTTSEYLACAYTQKIVKFCQMMHEHHEVYLYSNEENEAPCEEHVPIFSSETRDALFGPYDRQDAWSIAMWNHDDTAWKAWNSKATDMISERGEPGDFLLLVCPTQGPIAYELPELIAVEPFVGYESFWPERPHFFESYAWMHHVYGRNGINDGRDQDAVVPNYFDPDDFTVGEFGEDLLYLGRMIERKGVMEAIDIAKRCGRKIKLAGPGQMNLPHRKSIRVLGAVGKEERRSLLSTAYAVLMPTRYIEPFGGVAVEAMLSGRPVITTDFGAFTETVEQGVTGFRVRSAEEALEAIEAAAEFDQQACRARAEQRFSLGAVRPMFERAFTFPRTLGSPL